MAQNMEVMKEANLPIFGNRNLIILKFAINKIIICPTFVFNNYTITYHAIALGQL